jgi:hypothetical protein
MKSDIGLKINIDELKKIVSLNCGVFDCVNNYNGLCNLKSLYIRQDGICSRREIERS